MRWHRGQVGPWAPDPFFPLSVRLAVSSFSSSCPRGAPEAWLRTAALLRPRHGRPRVAHSPPAPAHEQALAERNHVFKLACVRPASKYAVCPNRGQCESPGAGVRERAIDPKSLSPGLGKRMSLRLKGLLSQGHVHVHVPGASAGRCSPLGPPCAVGFSRCIARAKCPPKPGFPEVGRTEDLSTAGVLPSLRKDLGFF